MSFLLKGEISKFYIVFQHNIIQGKILVELKNDLFLRACKKEKNRKNTYLDNETGRKIFTRI